MYKSIAGLAVLGLATMMPVAAKAEVPAPHVFVQPVQYGYYGCGPRCQEARREEYWRERRREERRRRHWEAERRRRYYEGYRWR